MKAKILILDIETAPNLALVWGAWKQNISSDQLLKTGYIMTYAAKWLGDDSIISGDIAYDGDDSALVKSLVDLIDEADIVVAHNGLRFDIPWINGRALVHGITPPSPVKYIDTLLVARKQFRFPINSLKALGEFLSCDNKKLTHPEFPGFDLWLECLKGNPKAWGEMVAYNEMDVYLLEEVYLKMRPWIRNHPNVAVNEEGEKHSCPSCGSYELERRGFFVSNVSKYQKYRCKSCGSWSRTRYNEYDKDKKKALLAKAM